MCEEQAVMASLSLKIVGYKTKGIVEMRASCDSHLNHTLCLISKLTAIASLRMERGAIIDESDLLILDMYD